MARMLHRFTPSIDERPLSAELKKKANPFHVKIRYPGKDIT
jgi:hypothetical protein